MPLNNDKSSVFFISVKANIALNVACEVEVNMKKI